MEEASNGKRKKQHKRGEQLERGASSEPRDWWLRELGGTKGKEKEVTERRKERSRVSGGEVKTRASKQEDGRWKNLGKRGSFGWKKGQRKQS